MEFQILTVKIHIKILFAVRWNWIVQRRRYPARCAPAGEAEAGSGPANARSAGGYRQHLKRILEEIDSIANTDL